MPVDRELTPMQELAIEQVIWLHREAGIPVRRLATRFSTSPARVSNWINRHQAPSPMSCQRIERAYQEEQGKRSAPGPLEQD